MKYLKIMLCVIISAAVSAPSFAGFYADLEGGRAFTGYNDVAIPGDEGTRISLSEDLETDPVWYLRGRAGYRFGERHDVSITSAPLRADSEGTVNSAVRFDDTVFPAGTPLSARYQFDTYRFTYRYNLVAERDLIIGIGGTGLIRDASVTVESGTERAEYTNVGFVPLFHFHLEYYFTAPIGIQLEGDAMAAPQGRAEDVMAALVYRAGESWKFRAGYRMLEGGADNDKVYTFAMFHFMFVGVTVML